jgi:hypothetical protein
LLVVCTLCCLLLVVCTLCCLLLVVCTLCCLFIHLLQPFDLWSPSVWSLYIPVLSWMPLTFQCRILLRLLFLRLTSTDYKTSLQKALISPYSEYENYENGNFCNDSYVYDRFIILPENYRFPLPISSFIVLTVVVILVEYLTRPTDRGVVSTGGKIVTCETRSTRRKTCPSATLSTQIPHGMAWIWTRSCLSRGSQWPAWAMTRPNRLPCGWCPKVKVVYRPMSSGQAWLIVSPAHPPVHTVQYNFTGP